MKEIYADNNKEIKEISYDINIIGEERFKTSIEFIINKTNENRRFINNIDKMSEKANKSKHDDDYFDYIKYYIGYFGDMLQKIEETIGNFHTVSFDSENQSEITEFTIKLNQKYNNIFNNINKIICEQQTRVEILDCKLRRIASLSKSYLNELNQLNCYYKDSMIYILSQIMIEENIPTLK